ncbi:hypothetical protein PM082_020026 [Marasmius tenuissimus]|nr:hypothetical protein PM082_020026 [Marasmius tenuissimus]
MYTDFVTWFTQAESLDIILPLAISYFPALYLTAFTTQLFFGTRIYTLAPGGKKILLSLPVVLLACLQIGFGIAQTILTTRVKSYTLLATTTGITSTQAGLTVACDITITVILCYVLNTSRSQSRRTDSIIDKLIIYAINRGAATSLAALVQLILFVAKPGTLTLYVSSPMLVKDQVLIRLKLNSAIFLTPSCHLYVISVCSMLISREGLRSQLCVIPETNFQLGEFPNATGNPGVGYNLPNAGAAVISGRHRGLQVFKEVSVRRFDDSFHVPEPILNSNGCKLEEV